MTGSPSLNLEKRREKALGSLFPQPLQFEGDGSYAVGAAGDRLSLVDPRVEVAAELRDGEVSVDMSRQAHPQKPSGMAPSCSTMNSWPSSCVS